jgi:hypothetical protein
MRQVRSAFGMIAQHVLLPASDSILEADERLASRADPAAAAALVPEEWRDGLPYAEFLTERLKARRVFADEAERWRRDPFPGSA